MSKQVNKEFATETRGHREKNSLSSPALLGTERQDGVRLGQVCDSPGTARQGRCVAK